jgi:hypothetical protein
MGFGKKKLEDGNLNLLNSFNFYDLVEGQENI